MERLSGRAAQDARQNYEAGIGIRSEDDLRELVAFFRARRGAAAGFRLRDPLDNSSAEGTASLSPDDQLLGVGDGIATRFALVKRYGDEVDVQLRRITRPHAGSVRVALDGTEQLSGWTLEDKGRISFAAAPAEGVEITAGFRFDVPVRFATDRLDISLASFRAGDAPHVPLIEIRED